MIDEQLPDILASSRGNRDVREVQAGNFLARHLLAIVALYADVLQEVEEMIPEILGGVQTQACELMRALPKELTEGVRSSPLDVVFLEFDRAQAGVLEGGHYDDRAHLVG